IMVANCRVNTTISWFFTGAPNDGSFRSLSRPLPFSLILEGTGWMRCVRRRTMTASRLVASISPLSVSPLGDTPCQRKVGMCEGSSIGLSAGGARRLLRGTGARSAVDAEHLLELVELGRVPQRLVDRDVVLLHERGEGLPHRLHAELGLADLHLRVDLVDLLLADEVTDGGVRDHDLGVREAP